MHDMNEPPILLVGTGAMASLFAAIFSSKGLKVRMLGTWTENIDILNENGVRFIDQHGYETHYPVEATSNRLSWSSLIRLPLLQSGLLIVWQKME